MSLQFGDLIVVEKTVDTDTNIYAANDQVGTLLTLADVFAGGTKKGIIESITILDKAKQSAALTLLFFDAAPTVASTNNAALDITDAELADKFVGKVEFAAASYSNLANSSIGSMANINQMIVSKSADLYMIVKSAGTPTYTSTSDLVLRIGIRRG